MSSNNESPTEKSVKRSNKTKKNAAEYQERVLSQVREMFDSILDSGVILSVVQNCNWKLQPSIEHLITLSANVNSSTEKNGNSGGYNEDFVEDERSASTDNPNLSQEDDAFEVDTDFTYLNINDEELHKQKEEFKKFELMRKHTQDFSQENSPSRLTGVINESPLETIEDEEIKSPQEDCIKKDFIKNDFTKHIPEESISEDRTKVSYSEIASTKNLIYPLFPKDEDSRKDLLTCNQNQLPTFNPEGSSQEALKNLRQVPAQMSNVKAEERRKTETESLCGLKVQYRFGCPETSSDDDADVVIEEESSDYNFPIPQNTQTNVCQFLSLSTQSPPKTTRPHIEMISTSSPFSSPVNKHKFKTNHKATLNRIKSAIQKGFKVMVIMRGLPGSGKSYLAKEIVQSTIGGDPTQYIFSTDDFFIKKQTGDYVFDPARLPEAHEFNKKRVLKAVREGKSPVIVDNTNTECWEMEPYVVMALQYGYFIEVLEPDTPWAYNVDELARRNSHGVRKASIQRMLERFERNITGEKLLKMFSLKYDAHNIPPQPSFPTLSPTKLKRESDRAKKENKKGKKRHKKLPETEEKLEDYNPADFSSARVVDSISIPCSENLTALQLAMKTFGGDDDDDLSPKENAQDLIEDKWEDDGISWEDERLKVEIKNKNSDALKESLNEESSSMDKTRNVGEAPHLNLGAIGSERKNSMVRNTTANDSDGSDNENILSQCWDFTLLLDGRQIHSVGSTTENEKADQEKGDEDSSEKSDNSSISDSSTKSDIFENSDNPTKSDNSEKSKLPTEELKEMQNTFDKDSSDCGTKSSNTESFEHIDSNSEDLLLAIRETTDTKESIESSTNCFENSEKTEKDPGNVNTDPQAKVSFGSIMKFIKTSILGANDDTSKAKKTEVVENSFQTSKTAETVIDSLTKKLNSPVKEHSPCNVKTLDYEVEVNLNSDSNDTLSKKLSIIAREFENANKNLVFEAQSSFESVEFLEGQTILKNSDMDVLDLYSSVREVSSDNESFLGLLEASNILSHEKINLNISNSEDNLTSTLSQSEDKLEEDKIKCEPIKLSGPLARAVLSLEENEKFIFEEKEFIKSETKNSDTNSNIKNVETKKSDTTSQYFETIDNINSITWKESPFPTYEIEMPVKVEEPKNVVTSEASTNTNIYDFNVLYIGGTNEPQYKLLNTFNRSINEGLIPSNLETPPPLKLKLDKSSMTNDVDVLLELPTISGEIEVTDKEMTQGLIDMFPHFPKDYVIDVYKNLCKGDWHWAIDVLLDGVPLEGILNVQPLKSPITENPSLNSSPARNKRAERLKQSSSSDSNESESCPQVRKKEKNHVSEDSLALKKHLEEKVMISEASYHPHILRVKKWKNREPDVSTEEIIEAQARSKDVLQFVNDLSPVEVATEESSMNSEQNSPKEKEESDRDDSSESEEMMELNLGWEFITNLEKEFGNPNFQLPDGLFPVIQVKKSLAEEIHALWIESMQQQMYTQQEHLDAMIAKDAEFAKTLEVEEAKALSDSVVPNLSEVMDMELALAVYNNDLRKQKIRETPLDMASRLTCQMLNEMFPDSDPETLSEILKAHNGNFKETVEVLEASTGRFFSSTDTLNKQNSLMVKVKQQSLEKEEDAFKPSSSTSIDLDSSTIDQLSYDDALEIAHESRQEAERQFSLRNENFNKAALAYRRGNPAVASYYSEMAKLHSRKMENANSAAASAFLAAQTHVLDEENTLDLHNLFVPEAMQALDIFLDHQQEILNRGSKRSVELFIITGRGARSNNNKSKIKPAVSRRLTSRNINFTEANPGCLKVKLHRNNFAST